MKKTFVFDKCEDELLNIDENTVIIETGIDAQRVKESIMKEIKEGKREKRASVKKFFSIMAIAAAIAAATITAHATGVFNPAFSELFAGEPANGIFPGANISVISDTLDIEFLGVTGDETEMISMYDIRMKDGSDFVDTFDTPDNYGFFATNADFNVTESEYRKFKEMIVSGGCSRFGSVVYTIVDEKTIRAYALFHDDLGCIKGERLSVTEWEATCYHIDEIVYSDTSDTIEGCSQFAKDNEEFINRKEASFNENQSFYMNQYGDRMILAVITETTVPLNYHLDVMLNYKTIEKTFPKAKGKQFSDGNTEWKVKEIKSGTFGIILEAVTDNNRELEGFDMSNSAEWSPEEAHEFMNRLQSHELTMEITLKDGTKIDCVGGSVSSETEPNGKSRYSWSFNFSKDGDTSKPYTLDPDDIVSIICNGTELFR